MQFLPSRSNVNPDSCKHRSYTKVTKINHQQQHQTKTKWYMQRPPIRFPTLSNTIFFRKMLHSFFFLNCRNRDGNHFRATSILSCFFFLRFFTAINPMLLKLYFKALICKRTRTNTKIVSCKPLYCKLTKYRGEQEKTINDFVACTWKYPISGGVLIKDGSFLS